MSVQCMWSTIYDILKNFIKIINYKTNPELNNFTHLHSPD